MKRKYSNEQETYMVAKANLEIAEKENDAAEQLFIKKRGIKNTDGTFPERIYCIDDEAIFDSASDEFDAIDRHAVAFFEAYQHSGYRQAEVAAALTAGQHRGLRGDTPIVAECYAPGGYGGFCEGVGALRASAGKHGSSSSNLLVVFQKIAFYVRYALRKLTPLECERLQGFPDYWTKYNAIGGEIADTPRYAALGNSLSVPCAERVFRGIVAIVEGMP